MQFDWPATTRIVHCHFAILLLLWWGGLNCLVGCLAGPASLLAEDHCPMSGEGSDCCLSQMGKDKPTAISIGAPSNPSQPLDCCSLQSLTADVKRGAHATVTMATTVTPSRIEFTPEYFPRVQFPDRWVRLPDRGGTHLLHCVFLI
jgi:hypothetical protein